MVNLRPQETCIPTAWSLQPAEQTAMNNIPWWRADLPWEYPKVTVSVPDCCITVSRLLYYGVQDVRCPGCQVSRMIGVQDVRCPG